MTAGELTYGGVSLFHDKDFAVNGFLRKYLRLEDLRCLLPELQSRFNGRLQHHPSSPLEVGNPIPQWPARPKIRLNQIYWPTGASRWAEAYFLASTTNKDAIVEAAHGSTHTALELKAIHDIGDTNYTFQADMYLLPPRPISCYGIDDSPRTMEQVWLIPLVDERYFWKHKRFTETVLSDTEWSELIEWLATDLGIEIDADDADSAYLYPDPESFLTYENAAMALDAVAFSLGMRFIREPDGDCKIVNWDTTEDTYADNAEGVWWQIAGDQLTPMPLPDKVEVAFQKIRHYRPCDNQRYVAESDSSDIPDSMTEQATIAGSQCIYSTLLADFTDDGETPDNDSEVTALVSQVAEDYYLSQRRAYDITFAGAKPWTPCGYDDHMLYNIGAEHDEPCLRAVTTVSEGSLQANTVLNKQWETSYWMRVQTFPYNFYPEHQLSQQHTLQIIGPVQVAKTTTTAVPAMSSDTPGREDVNLYQDDGAGDFEARLDASSTQMVVEAINMASSPTGTEKYIQMKDLGCGNWLIDWEECT